MTISLTYQKPRVIPRIKKSKLTFEELKKIFIVKSFSVEQDDVPQLMSKLRIKYKNLINSFEMKQRKFFFEPDNFS